MVYPLLTVVHPLLGEQVQDAYPAPDCFTAPGSHFATQGTLNTGPWANWPLTTSFRLDEWLEANPDAAEEGWFDVLDPTYDEIRPNSTLGWYTLPHDILRGNTRENTMSHMGERGLAQSTKEAFAYCTERLSCDGGMYLEVSGCYENKLESTTLDLHASAHVYMLGGDGTGIDGAVHPVSWFHHAGGDWLRSTWQFNNPQLRESAYGYPVTSAYNQTNVGLYDAVNVDAYGLGFGRGLLDGASLGNMSAADVMCGLEELYTYDTIVEAYKERGGGGFDCNGGGAFSSASGKSGKGRVPRNRENRQRAMQRAAEASAVALVVGGVLLVWRRWSRLRRGGRRELGELDAFRTPRRTKHTMDAEHMPGLPEYTPYGYDLSENDAAIRAQRGPLDGLGVQSL